MGFSWGVSFSNFIKWNWTSFDINHAAWHTPDLVCADKFDTIDAQAACFTLGYPDIGSFRSYNTDWSESEIGFVKNGVECGSAWTNFVQKCSGTTSDCIQSENILLTCSTSIGKTSCKFDFMSCLTKLVTRTNSQICHPSIVTRANRGR